LFLLMLGLSCFFPLNCRLNREGVHLHWLNPRQDLRAIISNGDCMFKMG
jgi:hypothetical protein